MVARTQHALLNGLVYMNWEDLLHRKFFLIWQNTAAAWRLGPLNTWRLAEDKLFLHSVECVDAVVTYLSINRLNNLSLIDCFYSLSKTSIGGLLEIWCIT